MSRPSYVSVLSFESLEARQVLSAHALGALAQHGPSHISPLNLGGVFHGHADVAATLLSAQLTLDGANVGTAKFGSVTAHGETRSSFTVQVHDLAADTAFDVAVDGVTIGQITTDADGSGKLVLSSDPKGSQLPLPANFPADLAAGSVVTVGTATGTLETRVHLPVEVSNLRARVVDAEGDLRALVKFHSRTLDDGTVEMKFTVRVKGAEANTTLDVAIDGVVVGQISTNARGKGSLVLSSDPQNEHQLPIPANFPTDLSAGAVVTIGTATGTLSDLPTAFKWGFSRHH
jgi:hypothetical protein